MTKLLLVFSAEWCGACKNFKREFERNPGLAGDVHVEILDVDRAKDIGKAFKIRSLPTFVLVNSEKGEIRVDREVARESGFGGAEKLQGWVKQHL